MMNTNEQIQEQIDEIYHEIERLKAPPAYYAIAYHGTAGLGWSYGYAEVVGPAVDAPREDMTTTVVGPMSKEEAGRQAATWNEECDKYRAERG